MSFWKNLFGVKNPQPAAKSVRTATAPRESLLCKGCNKRYDLPDGCIIMTMARTVGMFKTIIASPGVLEKPDVVYEITAKDAERLPDIIKENMSVIEGVRETVKAGGSKHWVCRKCETENDYQLFDIKTPQFHANTVPKSSAPPTIDVKSAKPDDSERSEHRRQIIAAMNEAEVETVCKLAKAHPELFDAKAKDDSTPLHFAVIGRQKDLIELLLAKGANLNAKTKYGETSLYSAASSGNKDLVEFLLTKGANANGNVGDDGQTVLHKVIWEFREKDLVELLLAKGANVHAKNRIGFTPLHLAAYEGKKDIAELLLAKGADVNAKSNDGNTPLHTAVEHHHKDIAELLIDKGADVNAKSNEGNTPLRFAGWVSEKDIAELLRANGAKE
jgi:ankyrin repeat protein